MPPKKETKKVDKVDDNGLTKKSVNIRIWVEVKEVNLSNIMLFMEWVNGNVENTSEKLEIGLIENWNVISEVSLNNQ